MVPTPVLAVLSTLFPLLAACAENQRAVSGRSKPPAEETAKGGTPERTPERAGAPESRGLPAFPGAEGFGATTPGGRGGRVIEVTQTGDSGPGSLRAALEAKGPRIVVFRISGTIENREPLCIEEPFVTVAGQTAPGDGIALQGEEVRVQTHDVVLRHLRIRTGDVFAPHDGWDNRDAMNFGHPRHKDTHDVVIDHCSLSWAIDETLTVWYESHDITIQHCMIAEALNDSKHPKGAHSMGVLIGEGSADVSFHHNLIAHCNGRNPQIAGAGVVDVRNNVIYDWGEYATLLKGPNNRINLVGNYYKRGPASERAWTKTGVKVREDARDMQLFLADNVDPTLPSATQDNWPMLVWYDGGKPILDRSMSAASEHPHPAVTTTSAEEAYREVLAGVGATRPRRDAVDRRIVEEVRTGGGGLIDSTRQVGGWPKLESAPPPADSDHDGMPDDWEKAHGLDPSDPKDGSADSDADGYTNVEEYLAELAGS